MLRYFLKYGKSQSRIWYSIFYFLELTVYMKEIKRYIIINYDTHGLILWKYSFNSLYKNCFTKHFSGFISIIKKLIAIFSLWHLVADRNTLESLRNFMLTLIKKSKRDVNDFFYLYSKTYSNTGNSSYDQILTHTWFWTFSLQKIWIDSINTAQM